MNRLISLFHSVALMAGLLLLGRSTPVLAAEDSGVSADRLERLERRVNEMAERQEQLMRRLGGQMDRQAAMGQSGSEHRPPQMAPAGAPLPAFPAMQSGHVRPAKGLHDLLGLLFLIGIICNILLSVWIYTDIRKRGEGSGIFVALALVAGIPAAIIYTLTRIGDKKV